MRQSDKIIFPLRKTDILCRALRRKWRLNMKKRLFCLLLGLILVLPMVFTACSDGDDTTADVSEDLGAQTITIRMVTGTYKDENGNPLKDENGNPKSVKVYNTDEELEKFLNDVCGGDKNDARYVEAKNIKAAYDRVEYEFSKITKSKYKVNVDFVFYTQAEYEDEISKTMDEYALEMVNAGRAERALFKYISDFKAAFPDRNDIPLKRIGMEFIKYYPEFEKYIDLDTIFEEDDDEKNNAVEEQYKENEFGIKELVYPETLPGQIDIVYISGLDMYNTYIDNEWIIPLDEHINTTGKLLNDYISPTLLNGVKYDGATYAIPNNVQIGEYTYMLVDKELFDSYYHNPDDVSNVLDLEDFLEDINTFEKTTLPLDATFEDCINQFVWYWNIDWTIDEEKSNPDKNVTWYDYAINTSNKFSLIGALYGDPATAGRGQTQLGFNNLFANEEYRNLYTLLKKYEFNNYYKTEGDTRTNAAVSFITDDYSLQANAALNGKVYDKKDENGMPTGEKYYGYEVKDENGNTKEYYAYIVEYPEADEEDLYGNMFAVSANSQHIKAAMEVITLINTNAEARNILQYGVEGVDYYIDDETGSLKRTKTQYLMDIEKTGNCFIAHPEEGLPKNYWDNAKNQNNDALINPLLGFDIDRVLNDRNTDDPKVLDNDLLEYAGLDSDPVVSMYPGTLSMAAQVQARIDACKTYEDLVALVEGLGNELTANEGKPFMTVYRENGSILSDKFVLNLAKLTSSSYDSSSESEEGVNVKPTESPYAIYYRWMESNGYLPKASK